MRATPRSCVCAAFSMTNNASHPLPAFWLLVPYSAPNLLYRSSLLTFFSYLSIGFAGIPPGGGNRVSASPLTRCSPPGSHGAPPGGHQLMVAPHPADRSHGGPSSQQHSHPPTTLNGGGGGAPSSAGPPFVSPTSQQHPPLPSGGPTGAVGNGGSSNTQPGQAPSPMQSLISVADTILPVPSSPRSHGGSPPGGPPPGSAVQLSRTPSRGSQHSPSSSGKKPTFYL